MIRYAIDPDVLAARVEALVPGWQARATARTTRFATAGRYSEKTSIWSEIKDVYMGLQFSKCAYCERKLEGPPYGAIEHDIEHFRPKNAVRRWPPQRWPPRKIGTARRLAYEFATGDAWGEGYYLLAYHLLNYATACKVCNSVFKSNYFPIFGSRGPQNGDPRALAAEKHLLLYPIGTIDADPEDLITFSGIIPVPKAAASLPLYRAQVTIDFFVLERREHLREERAFRIVLLWSALSEVEQAADAAGQADNQRFVDLLLDPSSAHCNCLRSFHGLHQHDPGAAREIYDRCRAYLMTKQWAP